MSETQYPEHEKLKAISGKSQACGEFVDWLRDEAKIVLARRHKHSYHCYTRGEHLTVKGGVLRCTRCKDRREEGVSALAFFTNHSHERLTCGVQDGELLEVQVPLQKLLAMHFDIDLNKIEDEKLAMLEELRRER